MLAWRQALKKHWRRALRQVVVIAVAILFLAFAKDPLTDIALGSLPTSTAPLLFTPQGPTALGYGTMGACVFLVVLAVFAVPYWLMSKILGLPVREQHAPR